ncbi:MAG: translesion DNA synthesis-associated protein ImuA [Pseudomonadales bacterium]
MMTTPDAPEPAVANLRNLLQHPDLLRAGQLHGAPETLSSGFAALDAELPGHGWPRAGLAEFLLGTTGVGELRLLAPLMRTLSQQEVRWIAWINPPFIPYAPALQALGIDVGKVLLIHAREHKEALWALERASRSGTCSMALAWLDERQLKLTDTRRLQLAAKQGRTLTCLFRPEQAAAANSLAELRLQLHPAEHGSARLAIRKRRGGWPVCDIRIEFDEDRPAAVTPREIREQLLLWRHRLQSRPQELKPLEHRPLEQRARDGISHHEPMPGRGRLERLPAADDEAHRVTH